MTGFKKIICEDAFAYKYLEFDFIPGIHSIGGLNGASKTSIYLALSQGLFNKNPKGVKIDDVSNIITQQPYRITIFFEKEGMYKIVNSRKNGTITIELNGKSLTRKTIPQNLELIKEILGDAYDQFVSMTYQSTESTLDLVEETSDTARKGFVNKILKFDELDELLAFNKEKLKQLKIVLKGKTSQLESLNLMPLRDARERLDISKLADEVEELKEQVRISEGVVEMRMECIPSAKAKYEAYSAYLVNVEKAAKITADRDAMRLPDRDLATVEKDIASYHKELAERELLAQQCRNRLNALEEPELICSRCGQAVSSEDAKALYDKELKDFTADYAQCMLEVEEVKGWLWLASEDHLDWKRYNEYCKQLSQLNTDKPEVFTESHYKSMVSMLSESKAKVKADSEAYMEKVKELTEAKGKNELADMVEKFNHEAEAHNAEVASKSIKLNAEIVDLERRIELVDTWTRILGSSGYRVHRMNTFLQVLNQLMVKYSNIISKGKIKCSFFLSPEGKIEFNVTDADKCIPFSGWSAGEKSRVKLSCLFAVLEVLEIMGGASYNVLFLDEVFATLDEGGRDGLFEVLAHLKSTGKCIYTVSHTPLVNSVVFDSVFTMIKENGLSRLV